MKRTRRISLEIEHRELFVSITQSSGIRPASDFETGNTAPSASATDIEKPCPVCGSPWLPLHTDPAKQQHTNSTLQALLACGLHVYCSPSGELWACRQSFQQIKEKP